MACEDIELATILAKTIKDIDKDIIYLVPTGSKMQDAAKKFDMRYCFIIISFSFTRSTITRTCGKYICC